MSIFSYYLYMYLQQITTRYNLPSNYLRDFNDDIFNFNCFYPFYLRLIGIDLSQMRSLFWRKELYIVSVYDWYLSMFLSLYSSTYVRYNCVPKKH